MRATARHKWGTDKAVFYFDSPMTLDPGQDLKLVTSTSDPASIVFDGNTYDITIGQRSANDYLCFFPSVADSAQLTFGKDTANADAYFSSYWFYANSAFQVRSGHTGEDHAEVHVNATYLRFVVGDSTSRRSLYADKATTGWLFHPSSAEAFDLGSDTYYFGDINYKTLDDKGCLGVFDNGVELPTGQVVSDLEALKSIQVDTRPGKETVYGQPMFDYRTMPKAVYRPAKEKGELLPRDENDEPYLINKDGKKVQSADGAELTALISIIIGAIKELDERLKEAKI